MAEETVTSHRDGVTVVERRSGGSGILIAIVLLFALVIGAIYLMNQDRRDGVRTDAVVGAAKSVSDSAQSAAEGVTSAADRAADKTSN